MGLGLLTFWLNTGETQALFHNRTFGTQSPFVPLIPFRTRIPFCFPPASHIFSGILCPVSQGLGMFWTNNVAQKNANNSNCPFSEGPPVVKNLLNRPPGAPKINRIRLFARNLQKIQDLRYQPDRLP